MYGADWCPDCRRAKSYLEASGIDFDYHDIELDQAAVRRVEEINAGKRILPTIEILGRSYANPDNPQLACLLGINPFGRVVLYGAHWCPDCRRAQAYLDQQNVVYQFIDIEQHDWAVDLVESFNGGKRIIPTVLVDGVPHANPDNPKLRKLLSLDVEAETECFDVVIVGAGAAGLTAAIYTQRERLSSLVLDRRNIGGNTFLTSKIENYPGFIEISGPDLMSRMGEQARTYGATIMEGVDVETFEATGSRFIVSTNMGTYEAKTLILAVGATYRRLDIPGEEDLIGEGIHFCATCDGPFYRGRSVIVVGSGNSALEEGMYLTEFADHVTFVSNQPEFSASETYVQKLGTRLNVTTVMNQSSSEFLRRPGGRIGLRIRDNETDVEQVLEADGVFIFIGLVPNTEFLQGLVGLDQRGFIQVREGSVETSVPGVFAAGDCRRGAVAQVASATGEGVLASFAARTHLKGM